MSQQRSLLIACGEPAIGEALHLFESGTLGGAPTERVLLPGGCWWLAEAAAAAGNRVKRAVLNRSAPMGALTAMLRGPGITRVALVGHQDCDWYRRQFPALPPGELIKRIGQDLYIGRDELLRIAARPLPITTAILLRTGDAWTARDLASPTPAL